MTRTLTVALILTCTAGCTSLRGAKSDAPSPMRPSDLSFLHPIAQPAADVVRQCAAVTEDGRDHTYIFLVNGLDPLYVANLNGLAQHVKELGYRRCYCGQMGRAALFGEVIRKVRAEDASARFVVVGYSTGANAVRTLAHELKRDGVRLDLLVYLGGDTIKNVPYSRPENVERILNVTGHGLLWLGYDLFFNGADLDGAANHRLDARHLLVPSRPETAQLLARHLAAVSAAAPANAPHGVVTAARR